MIKFSVIHAIVVCVVMHFAIGASCGAEPGQKVAGDVRSSAVSRFPKEEPTGDLRTPPGVPSKNDSSSTSSNEGIIGTPTHDGAENVGKSGVSSNEMSEETREFWMHRMSERQNLISTFRRPPNILNDEE